MNMYKGDLNLCLFEGGLKEVPPVHQGAIGKVATISLVTKRMGRNKETGQFEEVADWRRIKISGTQVEFLEQYGYAGMRLYIRAQHQVNEIVKSDNSIDYVHEFRAQELSAVGAQKVSSEKVKEKELDQDSLDNSNNKMAKVSEVSNEISQAQ